MPDNKVVLQFKKNDKVRFRVYGECGNGKVVSAHKNWVIVQTQKGGLLGCSPSELTRE